jgi:hypothetical protein
VGPGTFAHDYTHRSAGSCQTAITYQNDLVLESDGTATLLLSDTPMHVVSEDGSSVSCIAAGQGQLYAGTWVPSASDTVATITYGSTEEFIVVEIRGDVPAATATAAFDYEHRVYGSYRLDFELSEVE